MNQGALGWIVLGIGVLGLSAAALIFGVNMLPSTANMQSRLGTVVPLIITWGMIWLTVASGVALALYVFAYGMGKVDRS
jgi:hypothetical protein